MNEKLTLQDCFKYPKARIKYNSAKTESCESIDSFLTYSHLHKRDISDCKLILRPLSSLTDEEKENLVMMLGDIDGNGNETLSVPAWDIYSDDIITMDYLRSINVDIDGLQERGLCENE